MSKRIPITSASKIANEYDFDMTIIIGVNKDKSGHITTYGKTKQLCSKIGKIAQGEITNLLFNINGILDNTNFDN